MINETFAVPIAATCATVASTIFGYPFDTIKTKMQVGNYKSSLECIKFTVSGDGIRGLYYGALPVLVSTSFFRSVTFSMYFNSKNWLSQLKLSTSNHLESILAGLFSGSVVALTSAPLEFIKVLRQTENLQKSSLIKPKTLLGWTKYIYLQKGIKGFYSGVNLQLIRDSTGTAIYFFGYETCKELFKAENGDQEVPWWALSLSGGLAGSLVWISLFPVDL